MLVVVYCGLAFYCGLIVVLGGWVDLVVCGAFLVLDLFVSLGYGLRSSFVCLLFGCCGFVGCSGIVA